MIRLNTRSFIFTAIAAFLLILSLASCRKNIDVIPRSEIENMPSSTTKDVNLVLNDSGLVQLTMKAPLLEQYENVEKPYTEFRMGIRVTFFEGKDSAQARISSNYAKYQHLEKVWELRDSVEVIDNKASRLETELLYWSQEKDLIYTDRFVKLTSSDQIMTGMGFESDSHLRTKKFKKVWAIIYLNEETE